MPIYEFICPSCGHHFEKLVKLNQSAVCPMCECEETERQVTFSAGISTGKTQGKARAAGIRMNKANKAEQDRAHAEYLRKHNEDHH